MVDLQCFGYEKVGVLAASRNSTKSNQRFIPNICSFWLSTFPYLHVGSMNFTASVMIVLRRCIAPFGMTSPSDFCFLSHTHLPARSLAQQTPALNASLHFRLWRDRHWNRLGREGGKDIRFWRDNSCQLVNSLSYLSNRPNRMNELKPYTLGS